MAMHPALAKVHGRPWPPTPDLPLSTPEECAEAAAHLADDECEVEDDRGRVDWSATFDRLEDWYHLNLPTDSDAPQYGAIRRAIRQARR